MNRSVRWIALGGTLVAAIALFLLLRPDDGARRGGSGTPTLASPTPAGSPDASSSPGEGEPAHIEVRVSVEAGDVEGPGRVEVDRGTRVLIVVRADVTDEVHVHGYDVFADVAPGEPARIEFLADAPGVFEVELEEAGRLLFELEVGP
ncbi:MAG: hypothetical protein ACT4PO_00135 [Actinomycetota bacterium]